MMEIHGRSSGSGGEGRGNRGRVVMGLAGDGAGVLVYAGVSGRELVGVVGEQEKEQEEWDVG
nr:hypothetical protein [Tanacetum cinerariifolium]